MRVASTPPREGGTRVHLLRRDELTTRPTRRDFLRSAGASAFALPFSRAAYASARVAASDRLTVACIGVGSQGIRVLLDLLRLNEVQVVAVCDVNDGTTPYLDWGPNELRNKVRATLQDSTWGERNQGPAAGRNIARAIVDAFYARETKTPGYTGCATYQDYRQLLAKQHDLDSVVVSTPDHWHALISIAAMQAGKHVYSQKPMAHSVWEAREMPRVAQQTGRATTVSIFNAHYPSSSQVPAAITQGAIGQVHTVDLWTTRASSFWKQGLATPATADPVPAGLDWQMWLGPAVSRPYSHLYQPFTWRAWYDFGCGALGDMGEYGLDTVHRAVGLGIPTHIDASTSEAFPQCFPVSSAVHFLFPATQKRPPLQLNWFDGGMQPQRPHELPPGTPMLQEGVLYHGDRGKLLTEFMGQNARVLQPNGKLTALYAPEPKGERPYIETRPEWGAGALTASSEHYLEWIRACKGGSPARANYAFQQPIVETLMLGVIAQRTREALRWDAASMTFLDGSTFASSLVRPAMRAPFQL